MRPRTDEERRRCAEKGFQAFVGFMDIDSAHEAQLATNGQDVDGWRIRTGWGKQQAGSGSRQPIFVPGVLKERLEAPPESGLAFNAIMPSGKNSVTDAYVKVIIPENQQTRSLINRTIEFVIKHGAKFEKSLLEKEKNNQAFRFLSDYKSPEHIYYRWRLWSISHGEQVTKW